MKSSHSMHSTKENDELAGSPAFARRVKKMSVKHDLYTPSTWYEKAVFGQKCEIFGSDIVHINCNNLKMSSTNCACCSVETSAAAHTNTLINSMINFSFQVVQHHESADGATGDTCGPVRPAVQKGLRLLWQRSMAGPVLQVLEGGVPAGAAETDPRWLGLGRKVRHSHLPSHKQYLHFLAFQY